MAGKLQAVRLHLEEGCSQSLVCQEPGVSKSSLDLWLQRYRLATEAGLQPWWMDPPKKTFSEIFSNGVKTS